MSTTKIKCIGVMTSGGDAPGMNACIRAVVRTATAHDVSVIGVENSFAGLIKGIFRPLGARDVGGILQRGGTILQTAPSPEFHTARGMQQAIREMNNAGMQALVVIGGGGSLAGTQQLAELGVPVVGVPATIDNDIYGTDISIGVDTALNTIEDAIDKIRDTATSHGRAFLVETMGHKSGYLAVLAGIISGAEMILIPEVPTKVKAVSDMVSEAYTRGKTHCIIVVAEGASPGTSEIARMLNEMDVGFTTRVTILGHIQRGGKPSAFDRLLASRFGSRAVELLLAGQKGIMVALVGNEIKSLPLHEVTGNTRRLPEEYIAMARTLAR